MGTLRRLSWVLVALGGASLVAAGLSGDLEVHVLLVIPVLSGTGPWAALGMLAVMAGLFGLFWTGLTPTHPPPSPGGSHRRAPEPGDPAASREPREEDSPEGAGRTRSGGVILLGPIPIAWGSDRPSLVWLVLLGLLLTLVAVGLTLFVNR